MAKPPSTREELFALVWERPVRDVARELGVSDVALSKRCWKLQVPTPPRGYWAKVQAGKLPPRPPLEAFLETKGRAREANPSRLALKLSPMQRRYLALALQELRGAGADTSLCELAYDGVRSIDPDLASQVLIYVQHHYERWLPDDAGHRAGVGARHSIQNLAAKLLPLARSQVAIFRRQREQRGHSDDDTAVVVRLTPDLLRVISRLRATAREFGLSYAARPLHHCEHVLQVKYAMSPSRLTQVTSDLCVSSDQIWIRCQMPDPWDALTFETERHLARDLLPVDPLPDEIELPPTLSYETVQPYETRLKALADETRVLEMLQAAVYRYGDAAPADCLRLADRLWFGDRRPFADAIDAARGLDSQLEHWERQLEADQQILAQDVLGIRPGDTVLSKRREKAVRLRVHEVSSLIGDDRVYFHISGTRYRKDGTLGKLTETVYLTVSRER